MPEQMIAAKAAVSAAVKLRRPMTIHPRKAAEIGKATPGSTRLVTLLATTGLTPVKDWKKNPITCHAVG